MWSLDNRTPYAAERTSVIDGDGHVVWVVVVKATFDISRSARPALAPMQQPVEPLACHIGEPGRSSLLHEADLVPPKPATDVLIRGHAHAPHGRAAAEFSAGFRLLSLSKILTVYGDRQWVSSGLGTVRPGPPRPVTRVPLVYERAFGGTDTSAPKPADHRMDPRNPVGCGLARSISRLHGTPVHNFAYPDRDPGTAGPAGFGPLCSYWQPRLRHAGTYDAVWAATRKPLLPKDFDPRHYLCAPIDQQWTDRLPLGATLELINLSDTGVITVELPRIHLGFVTYFAPETGKQRVEHRGHLNTITVEPDKLRLTMVWATSLECGRFVDYIDSTRIVEKVLV